MILLVLVQRDSSAQLLAQPVSICTGSWIAAGGHQGSDSPFDYTRSWSSLELEDCATNGHPILVGKVLACDMAELTQ